MSIGGLRPSEPFRGGDRLGRAPRSARPQVAEKAEVQEALPPAGVLGAILDYHIKCNTAPKKERHCVRFVLE